MIKELIYASRNNGHYQMMIDKSLVEELRSSGMIRCEIFRCAVNLPVSAFSPGIALAKSKHARPSFSMLSVVIGP